MNVNKSDVRRYEDFLNRKLLDLRDHRRGNRTRTRQVQRSSWVTSDLLHLPDGPATQARDHAFAAVAENFSWIHSYDVQREFARTRRWCLRGWKK